jgi:3-deoxy-D-manno-octulosonate 8-phosphate phosphatase (KDO 8-P phosphatase)
MLIDNELHDDIQGDELQRCAKLIKLVIFDVDGVLTDGRLYFNNQGEETKAFYSRDGLGIKMLLLAGIEVAIITGRQSTIVARRAAELGIKHVYQGQPNKVAAFYDCIQTVNVTTEQVAFMGDDINDLAVMKLVGFSIVPPNATLETQASAHWVTTAHGGEGAARELCDLILKTQNKWHDVLKFYGH